MEKLMPIIFKHGVTGVLALWLFTVQTRLQTVEAQLYNCLDTRVKVSQVTTTHKEDNFPPVIIEAVLTNNKFEIDEQRDQLL